MEQVEGVGGAVHVTEHVHTGRHLRTLRQGVQTYSYDTRRDMCDPSLPTVRGGAGTLPSPLGKPRARVHYATLPGRARIAGLPSTAGCSTGLRPPSADSPRQRTIAVEYRHMCLPFSSGEWCHLFH